MRKMNARNWLIYWLYAAAAGHFLIGALLPWISSQPLVEIYHQLIEQYFWPGAAPDAARNMQIWWMSLFGATVQTVGLWMGALVYFGDKHRSRFAWGWLMAGILVWAPQDMLISMQARMMVNVWVDCFALVTLIPPLLLLWKIDAQVAQDAGSGAGRGRSQMKAMPAKTTVRPSEGELFRRILGSEWLKLHPDIQARFAKNPEVGQPLYYTGVLSELSCSGIGKLFGHITKPMIAGALIPYTDHDFPVDIEVYSKANSTAIFKQRIYRLHNRAPIQFTSYMQESEKGEVLEYVGKGLGMKLRLHVHEGNLYFTSDGYFWDVLGVRIPIPGIFTPGKTYLCHRNDNAEQFNIRIEIKHALFGTTFKQVGVFHDLNHNKIS